MILTDSKPVDRISTCSDLLLELEIYTLCYSPLELSWKRQKLKNLVCVHMYGQSIKETLNNFQELVQATRQLK